MMSESTPEAEGTAEQGVTGKELPAETAVGPDGTEDNPHPTPDPHQVIATPPSEDLSDIELSTDVGAQDLDENSTVELTPAGDEELTKLENADGFIDRGGYTPSVVEEEYPPHELDLPPAPHAPFDPSHGAR